MTLDRIEGLNNGGIVNLFVKLWLSVSHFISVTLVFIGDSIHFTVCVCSITIAKLRSSSYHRIVHFIASNKMVDPSKYGKIPTTTKKNKYSMRDNIVTYTEFTPELPWVRVMSTGNSHKNTHQKFQMLFFARYIFRSVHRLSFYCFIFF